MIVRIRIRANRQGIQRAAVFAGLTIPVIVGAGLLRPTPPPDFDYAQFERERFAASMAKKAARLDPREAKQPETRIDNLGERIEATLVEFGTGQIPR
jgi:hypothetical protein